VIGAPAAAQWVGDFIVRTDAGTHTVSVDSKDNAVHVDGHYVGDCVIVGADIWWQVGERWFCMQNAFGSAPEDSGSYAEYPPLVGGTWTNVEL
jgi:hypothetical protein